MFTPRLGSITDPNQAAIIASTLLTPGVLNAIMDTPNQPDRVVPLHDPFFWLQGAGIPLTLDDLSGLIYAPQGLNTLINIRVVKSAVIAWAQRALAATAAPAVAPATATASVTPSLSGIPTWAYLAAGGAALYMLMKK